MLLKLLIINIQLLLIRFFFKTNRKFFIKRIFKHKDILLLKSAPSPN